MTALKHTASAPKITKGKPKRRLSVSRVSHSSDQKPLSLTLSNESFSYVRADPQFFISVIEETAKTIKSKGKPHDLESAVGGFIRKSAEEASLKYLAALAPNSSTLQDSLRVARKRGKLSAAEILNGSDMLTTKELAKFLHLSPPAVNTQRQNGKLLGLDGAKRGYKFPNWQLDENQRPYEAIARLNKLLGDPWLVYRFIVQRHGALEGMTGLQVLKERKAEDLLQAAQNYGRDFS